MADTPQPAPPVSTPPTPAGSMAEKGANKAVVAIIVITLALVAGSAAYLLMTRPKPVPVKSQQSSSASGDQSLTTDEAAVIQSLTNTDTDLNAVDQGLNDKQGDLSE